MGIHLQNLNRALILLHFINSFGYLQPVKLQNLAVYSYIDYLIQNCHAFFTNCDFNFITPIPSILQSMSWSPSTSLIFLTLVPTLTIKADPFTFKSLITITVSPSFNTFPVVSLITFPSTALPASSSSDHSCAHSGQI